MSEEQTTETNETTETIESPTQPAMDLDSTIKVDGEEISVRDLLSSRDEVAQLKEYNEQAKLLISPNSGDTETRENAVRYLMTQEGYSSQDIEEYISWTNNTAQEIEGSEAQNEQPIYEQPQYDQAQQAQYEEQLRMQEQERNRLGELEERQSRISSEMMKKEMDEVLQSRFDSSDDIRKLMGVVEEGDASERLNVLKKEVETTMLEGLRSRRQAGENFKKSWFDEEASKATKLVYDKFRSVIGDPDKIQRSPETATEDSLFNKPPVDPPKYEKGDDMGDINIKAREWTLDTLLRGAQEGAAGGESKA